ncbi:hypothetical protein FEDK69T_28010 [Flavobacterium enshiense DK69]|uniref:Outer membrane protein beta-barrel domain-containing protein n=1 Tax=Flavobacterium enshiense DK69 TaxID=1107311 RepID=V6S0U3_9FLAO|nr:outer membrane beta-barrel protein [Flavobacterium enshiense]ESU20288.1 hypothetical protein FEDK69T_28010 [Flavobacterium enshiense DK69]KGO95899.1 hypothetical protein Q767_09470 [Flavobacterium enshiense DK69]
MNSFKTASILLFFFVLNNPVYSQYFNHYSGGNGAFDGRFGITAGYTNYVLDSNVLFTRSQPGYSIGVVGTAEFTDYLELLVELNYTHHRTQFIGRADINSEPEDIDFKLENINIPIILNYNFLRLNDDKWKFGVNAGITLSLLQSYVPSDESKEAYLLDPVYLNTEYLKFDEQNETISFNAYLPMGVSVEFANVMCNLRYNMGLTDPFRQAPFYNTAYETEAKQNYYSVSFTYFFND